MWILTTENRLINSDHLSAVVYDPKHDQTVGFVDGKTIKIDSGDHVNLIAGALSCNYDYLEVRKYE